MNRYQTKPVVRRRVPLGGQHVVAVGYDRDTETLEARLVGGLIVRYEGVAMVTFCELVNAEDVDRYFAVVVERYCRARPVG